MVIEQPNTPRSDADRRGQDRLAAAFGGSDRAEYERMQRELTGYCYRMLGSLFDADDAVQETMIRAWRGIDGFDGRSAVRTWLHRIATNVCIDMLRGRGRRAVPMDLRSASPARAEELGPMLTEEHWVLPAPDDRVLADTGDPARLAESRASVRLAFLAALQRLPARQRAALILRDVLGYSAAETAELLDTTVASANSALQRARAATPAPEPDPNPPDPVAQQELLAGYVDAFERYDLAKLTLLLREDAVQSMPPFGMWLRGSRQIIDWMRGPGAECRGSLLLPGAANGGPAFAQYRPDGSGGHQPWALQVVETSGTRISALHCFLSDGYPALFQAFGFPATPSEGESR